MPSTILDPGHGGGRAQGGSSAHGVRGPGGTLEKDVTIALARIVAARLGGDVRLTRHGDENPTLAARAKTARDARARVFLSLHANQGPRGARGSEVWVHSRGGRSSVALARTLHRALSQLGAPDRGIKAADMRLLRPEHLAPGAAACLLEVDFLSHPDGERRLRNPASLARIGHAIAEGLRAYLSGGLDVDSNSSQKDQSDAVLQHVARSMQQKEGTKFDQVHYDSGIVNFGIGSWTGPRIATVMDMYETVASENGTTDTLYGFFGGQDAFNDLRARFRANQVAAPMDPGEQSELEAMGKDKPLQQAQVRLLAQEVKKYVDAISTDNKYPFIDGYMGAISEVAAQVLAHATHQHGRVNDLIAEVIANHGGQAAFSQMILDGTMTEHQFLTEIGEAVANKVQAKYQNGVRRRYNDLITQFENSGLGYFFDPDPATAHALDDLDALAPDSPDPTGSTVEEIKYAINDGVVNKVARLVRDDSGATMIFDCLGTEKRATLGPINDADPSHAPDGYTSAAGKKIPTAVAFMVYILLYAYGKWKKAYGCETSFYLEGKWWLGKYAVHKDQSPDARPYPHPGVDLFVANDDPYSGL